MTVSKTLTTNRLRLLLALVIGALAVWLNAPQASAHAAYESSSPAFAEELDESPTEITIRFTQELFRREGANTMELARFDSRDLLSDFEIGPVRISNEDRHVMSATIPVELPPGGYGVRWTNLSAEDGDEDSGWLTFYVQWEPRPWQVEQDRSIAAELLITYPADAEDESAVEPSATSATPAVVRSSQDGDASLGPGPIAWLAVGGFAALLVVGSLGFYLGVRRRNA
jgi:methionine-rich copper-binding protein CopC